MSPQPQEKTPSEPSVDTEAHGSRKDEQNAVSLRQLEASPLEERHPPQMVHEYCLQKASDGLQSVTALACSPVGSQICAATKDRVLHLLRGGTGREESFSARPLDKASPLQLITGRFLGAAFPLHSRHSAALKLNVESLTPPLHCCTPSPLVIRAPAGLAFNHDGSQVAVAQSDGVAHVYSLNQEGRRRICCRLPVECPVTCVAWATAGHRLLFLGLLNGKVRIADVAANKLGSLHEARWSVRLQRGRSQTLS